MAAPPFPHQNVELPDCQENWEHLARGMPWIRATNSIPQNIANITVTNVVFDTVRAGDATNITYVNVGGIVFQFNISGVYLIQSAVHWQGSAALNTLRYMDILVAGVGIGFHRTPGVQQAGQGTSTIVSTLYRVNRNDGVTVRCYQDTGGALNVEGDSTILGATQVTALWVST